MFHLVRHRLEAAVLVVLLAGAALGAGAAGAQTPPAVAPSPEEQLLSILPYRLQPPDIPGGFRLFDQRAITPARRAYDLGADDEDSRGILSEIQQTGLLAGFEQVVGPNDTTPIRAFVFRTYLYASTSKASAALKGNLQVPPVRSIRGDNPPLTVQLGEESGALHLAVTQPDSNNTFIEAIFWRRGRVLFLAELQVVDGTESIDQVVPLAQTADRRAMGVAPPAPLTAATLPAAGDEQYRVDAMYALGDRLPNETERPYGFRAEDIAIVTVADQVLAATDPTAAYNRIAGTWKRVVEIDQTYDTLQNEDGDELHVRFALDADAASANANLLDPPRLGSGALDTYSLPQPLGDNGRLYHESFTSPTGVPSESWRAAWTHGRVLLTVYSSGPAGDFSAQSVAALAATVDARYSKGALPDILTQPVPAPQPLPPGP